MLTAVQKEILQNLINLYQTSNGSSVKGEDIAEVMNRNPGTIRNQMQALRSLSLVKGVPGPQGGYKPTIEAYQTLKVQFTDQTYKIPLYRGEEYMEGLSVVKIEFTSIPHPAECEASIKVLGSIKNLEIGDIIRIGPTPVNNLGIMGEIVGRDDMDNLLLLDIHTIRSIPKNPIKEIASTNLITLQKDDTIRLAAKTLSENNIDGAPVIQNKKAIGVITLSDIVKALSNSQENLKVENIMSEDVFTINENIRIGKAVEQMYKNYIGRLILVDDNENISGIVTRTDLIDNIVNIKKFPIIEPRN